MIKMSIKRHLNPTEDSAAEWAARAADAAADSAAFGDFRHTFGGVAAVHSAARSQHWENERKWMLELLRGEK